jgi:hypothetical protein
MPEPAVGAPKSGISRAPLLLDAGKPREVVGCVRTLRPETQYNY